MRILISSGGTKVPIDRVRDITNLSHGTFGARIAHEALRRKHEVTFLCARHSKSPFSQSFDFYEYRNWGVEINRFADLYNFCEEHRRRYREVRFRNFADYAKQLESLIRAEEPQVVILAAAVSDYGVENYLDGKVRTGDGTTIELSPLPKLIGQIKQWLPSCFLVGFKLLVGSTTDELLEAAQKSIRENGCDLVIANDLRDIQADDHRVFILTPMVINEYHKNDDPYYLARIVIQEMEREWDTKYSSALPVV